MTLFITFICFSIGECKNLIAILDCTSQTSINGRIYEGNAIMFGQNLTKHNRCNEWFRREWTRFVKNILYILVLKEMQPYAYSLHLNP